MCDDMLSSAKGVSPLRSMIDETDKKWQRPQRFRSELDKHGNNVFLSIWSSQTLEQQHTCVMMAECIRSILQ